MSLICKSNEIKNIEENCFKNGLPVAALMEKAGLKCSSLFKKIYPKKKFLNIGIFVGPGHNGADALVVARELLLSGYKTFVYLANNKLKQLTSEHLNYYLFLGGEKVDKIGNIECFDVIIDGLFGFGLTKKLDKKYIDIINTINESKKEIVSIDIPSGMNADFGHAQGACIKATHTFCLAVYKQGLIQDHAVDYVGKLNFLDIGLRPVIESQPYGLTAKFMSPLINVLEKLNGKRNLNKYTNGVSLLFAGSNKYPGAGILSAKGAMAAGTGYVQLCCSDEEKYSVVSKIPEVICQNLHDSLEQIDRHIHNKNFAILCGSGTENNDNLKLIIDKINSINKEFPCLVIDASSLNLQNYQIIKEYKGPKILTPHMGEFAKIFPKIHEKMIKNSFDQVDESSLNKIGAVKIAAKEINGIVLLKGPHTVIANEIGEVFVDIESTSALARAGCGDVLAGFIVGLIAKGLSPLHATCCGVFLQSQTAIRLEKELGRSSVSASSIVNGIIKNF